MLDTGLRASELCGLTLDDTHIEQGYLKVLGKGNKERRRERERQKQRRVFP